MDNFTKVLLLQLSIEKKKICFFYSIRFTLKNGEKRRKRKKREERIMQCIHRVIHMLWITLGGLDLGAWLINTKKSLFYDSQHFSHNCIIANSLIFINRI